MRVERDAQPAVCPAALGEGRVAERNPAGIEQAPLAGAIRDHWSPPLRPTERAISSRAYAASTIVGAQGNI